jgi:hypothetical protein
MRTDDFTPTLETLFRELTLGTPASGGYILNPGDDGLLASLDRLPAVAASARTSTGSSIAAHADHVRYGLSLMNRWSAGEKPFEDADWSASWRRTAVDEDQWRQVRAGLRSEVERWLRALAEPREVQTIELNGMVGSIAHLAYHLGAIRQIDPTLRGPVEGSGRG